MNNPFSKDFLWGAASAAPQIEGGFNEGGRTPSIWDIAPARRIKNGENCHTASDHFHHMKEDVALMKEMGLKSYRFSVSWSRVIPEEGKVNQQGIKFYSDLVNELIVAGIEPLVTIYHWDLPLWVYKQGGWISPKIIPLFRDYTKVVVEALSDRVNWWLPINEPSCFIMNGHMQGVHAPFKHKYLALNKLTSVCMRATAESVKAIRKHAKKPPKVGIAFATSAYVPDDETPEHIERARMLTFEGSSGLMSNSWWMDPMVAGKPVKAYGIFRTSKKYLNDIKPDLDFIGINSYEPLNYASWGGDGSKPAPGTAKNSMGWVVDGRTLYWTAKFLFDRYKLPLMVTENGFSDNDCISLDGKVHDPQRTDYIKRYLGGLKRALSENIPVLGYQYWSVMDNFEWAEGYDPRFGLIYVDYPSGKRIMKDSAYEYKKIIQSNGEHI